MPFELMSEPCDQCLMTNSKIVSNARRREIIRETMQRDCAFICHKASIAHREIACKGHYDATGGGQMARIAGRLNAIVLVNPKDLEKVG
jgi:hypothetical protein